MKWSIQFVSEFDIEYQQMNDGLQNALLSHLVLLEKFGPQLGRPKADTLNGSRHANMKELRFDHDDGVWRVAYAVDTQRNGIVLVAGDRRFTNHLRALK